MTYNVFGGTLSLTQSINHPASFYLSHLVCPLFFVNSATNFFYCGCHPLEGVTRGGPPRPSPSDAAVYCFHDSNPAVCSHSVLWTANHTSYITYPGVRTVR